MPSEGFQRNQDNTFTVTLKTTETKNLMTSTLQKEEINSSFSFKTTTADIIGGRLTIIGCPNDYPNPKLAKILQQYVDVMNVKDGYYKDFPSIKNGMKQVSYRKEIKPVPGNI